MKKERKINLTKPWIDSKELRAAERVLKSGWLIRGPQTKLFEDEFAKFIGAPHVVATNGCTMALYLAVKQMNLQPDDEVIVPALTWHATASAVINAGAKPVFADVRLEDWCLDPVDVRRKITHKTKLIIPVHFAGRFAQGFENFPLPVVFDSAHRIEKGDFMGTASCYSFYAVKNMTTVRGGMIITDDAKASERHRMGCHGGIAKDTLSRYQGAGGFSASSFYYEVDYPGWNFDMTDVEAAIGREQLKKLEKLNKKRNAIVVRFNKAFGLSNTGNHLYPILVENRDEFLVRMREAGIQCGVHYLPLHTMKAFRPYAKGKLPMTEYIGARCVSLPLYPALSRDEVDFIIAKTKELAVFSKK